jgi:WD40 repeat protein
MKAKRNRGVLLTLQGWQKFQEAVDKLEQQENLSEKFTLGELGKRTRLDGGTIAKILNREEGVDRRTLEQVFKALNLVLDKSDYTKPNLEEKNGGGSTDNLQVALQGMPDVPVFYGRTEELASLEQCLLDDRCRLVAILGMGGIGKTSLAVKLVERIQDEFDYFIWHSLHNAPPLADIVRSLIQLLSSQQQLEVVLPQNINAGISQLIHCFSEYRCLIILDNAEAILSSGDKAGRYREGYEDYGELFRQIGEQRHQSCLLLTSREKPKEIGLLEGPSLPVRSFEINGLDEVDSKEIFNMKGTFVGSEEEWRLLVKHYAGNPLALRIVAAAIQELFDGSVTELVGYLKRRVLVFDDIRDLLNRQFERLSDLEREIMYWLAIEREPISLDQLRDNVLSGTSRRKLPEGLRSLRQRSLIEMSSAKFSQQPVIMEYMTDRIVEKFSEEIATEKIEFLTKYASIKSQAKDYIRESQVRLILEPVAERIKIIFSTEEDIKKNIGRLLLKLKKEPSTVLGYGAGNILNLLCQLKIDLTGYDFSNLVVWQAYLRDVRLHHVNFAHADLEKSVFIESFGNVLSIAFSPDGKLLAIGDTNSEICLWEVKNTKQMLSLKGHESWVWSVSFIPVSGASPEETGQILASGSQDSTIKLWDVRTGQCLKTLQGDGYAVRSVEFSPDGKTLASGHADANVRLWDVRSGECLKTLQGHTQGVWSVGFSSDGRTLASGSLDHTARLWDVHTGQCLQILNGHTSWVWSVSFSPDSKTLASGSDDRTVKLWDVHTGQCLNTLHGHDYGVRSVRFNPVEGIGQTLASGSDDRTVRLWNAHTGQCLNTLHGHDYGVRSVRFNPVEGIGQTLASSTGDNQVVRFWDVHTGQCLKVLQGYAGWIWSIRFSPDGKTLASGSHDRIVRLWDINTGRCIHELNGHTSWVRSVSFSPVSGASPEETGQILASSSDDQTIRLWDIHTGLCLNTLYSHARVFSVSFSPNGQILASGHDDRTVRLWDVQTGQCLNTLNGHTGWISSVDFSPDGQTLASGSLDHSIRLWDVRTGQCSKELKGHSSWVWSVSFSPDGQTLASGSDDRTVRLWNVQNGECLEVLKGHDKGVWAACFSPIHEAFPEETGHMLATSSEDKTIKLWSVDTGTCIRTLQGHSSGIWAVDFSPHGYLLASGSQDETTKLWDVATGENVQTLKADSPYEGMDITEVRGLSQAQKSTLKNLGAQESAGHFSPV